MRYAWPFRNPGMGSIFLNTNRNKRSLALDLKQAAAREACLALAAKSDVLVYNIRPQAMARLKLSYEEVRAVNERIIYRSEEHTSELQSLTNLVCRLLLEKKKEILQAT